jgi:hypothetical protein
LKVTDETWTTRDGRRSRGWLLKGAEGAPAVVLLHRYGGDRSWLFNLGVKINETLTSRFFGPTCAVTVSTAGEVDFVRRAERRRRSARGARVFAPR